MMKRTIQNLIGKLLIGGGGLLLVIGGVMVYPYVRSRLTMGITRLQAAPTATVTPAPPTIALTNTPTTTYAPYATITASFTPTILSTSTPTKAPTITASLTPTIPPTSTPTKAPTPPPDPTTPAPPLPTSTIPPGETDPLVPQRIVIPTIGLDAPVVPVSIETVTIDGREQSTWQAPDTYAAGWHESSARLGERENLVLNGHNTAHGEVFRDLYTLEPGATIRLHSDVITKTYAVAELLILKEAGQPMEVRLKNARYIMPTADERLTLVTCHPYGSLRNRLIVIARPVDDD